MYIVYMVNSTQFGYYVWYPLLPHYSVSLKKKAVRALCIKCIKLSSIDNTSASYNVRQISNIPIPHISINHKYALLY
jgi:hypothetical protein